MEHKKETSIVQTIGVPVAAVNSDPDINIRLTVLVNTLNYGQENNHFFLCYRISVDKPYDEDTMLEHPFRTLKRMEKGQTYIGNICRGQ